MADIADDANDAAEQALARSLARVKGSALVIEPCGHCLFCGATELPDGSAWPPAYRWCDKDCREDHQRELQLRGGQFR